jgi:hypothetical protein
MLLGRLLALSKITRQEKAWQGHTLAYYEHLLITAIKKLYNFGLRAQCYKTLYLHNLRIFVIGLNVCVWQAFTAQSNVCG